jgi:hypothetical protein
MGQLATMVFATRAGSQLALEPHSGRTGAVGIFMPREGVDQFFPLPKYTEQYAESPDTEGGRRILSQTENATGTGTVVVAGDDEVSFQVWHQRWQEFVEEMRREGGTLAYTPAEGTAVTYEIESMKITGAKYDGVKMLAFVQEFEFEFVCRPYGLLSTEEQTLRDHDPFTRDTINAGEWAPFDVGAGTLSVSTAEGLLVPSSTAEKRLYRYGLKAADSSTTIKVTTGASVASGGTHLMMKRLDTTNWVQGSVSFVGASTRLRVFKIDGGIESSFGESTAFTATANTAYWLKTTIVGNVVSVSIYTDDPETGAVPLKSFQVTLEGADAVKFGDSVYGNAGLRLVPAAGTDYRWDEWRWDSKEFRSNSPLADFELPEVKGHVPALGELTYTDMSNQPRRYADYGLERGGTFNPAVSPPNLIDSDQLVTATFGGVQATRTGSYDPLASGNNVIRATLSSFPTVVCSTGPQKHVGPYRVKARVHVDPREPGLGVGPAYVRFAASGSSSGPFTKGEWVQVPVMESWCDVDLGVAEAPPAKAGEQSWEVRVEALSESAGDTIDVDYIEFFGATKYAKVKNPVVYETPTLVTAQDQFNQSPEGAIAGKVIGSASGESSTKLPTADAENVGAGVNWFGLSGIKTLNGDYTQYAGLNVGEAIKTLVAKKFAMGVPLGATIKGIEVKVWRYDSAGDVEDSEIKLRKASGAVGSNKAIGGAWPKSLTLATYGGPTDLWGTTWTVAEVNEEAFGLGVLVKALKNSSYFFLDTVQITVYYTPAGGLAWKEFGAKEPKFTLKTATHLVERAGTGTDEANKGRKMWVPVEASSQAVQAELTPTGEGGLGVMTRYKEATDQRVAAILNVVGGFYIVRVIKWASSVATELQKPLTGIKLTKTSGQTVLLRLQVEADGRWMVWADGLIVGQGYDKSLSEGELASGASGVYSVCGAGVFTHKIDNFVCWTPEFRAALWAGRPLRFRSADAIKENAEGGSWSPASGYEGARLRVPPAGPAGLTSRLNVRGRRTNVDESVDEWISDEMQVSLRVTPRVVLLG